MRLLCLRSRGLSGTGSSLGCDQFGEEKQRVRVWFTAVTNILQNRLIFYITDDTYTSCPYLSIGRSTASPGANFAKSSRKSAMLATVVLFKPWITSPVWTGISDVSGLNVSAATAALESINILVSTQ
jgi:hypothetical protein